MLVVLALTVIGLGCCGGEPAPGVDAGRCDLESGSLQPFEVGFTWSYSVTEPPAPGAYEISRRFTREVERGDGLPALELETIEPDARILELLRHDGTAFVLLQREVYDGAGNRVLTSTYDPPSLWVDEAPERTAMNATWDEEYLRTDTDGRGEVTTSAITERWLVEQAADLCVAPIGERTCLFLERSRIAGGALDLDLEFSRGLGKLHESGAGRVELLTGCAPPP